MKRTLVLLLVLLFLGQVCWAEKEWENYNRGWRETGDILVGIFTFPFRVIGGMAAYRKAAEVEVELIGWVRRDFTDREDAAAGESVQCTSDMYIFDLPNLNSESVGVMRAGNSVQVLEKSENTHGLWYKVSILTKEYHYPSADHEQKVREAREKFEKEK